MIYEKAYGPDNAPMVSNLDSLAGIYRATHRETEAVQLEVVLSGQPLPTKEVVRLMDVGCVQRSHWPL